jgi:DNA invertase Pin-like site-specific DNA recombinase
VDTVTRPKAIGYIRVSTNRQAENGYGLDAQRSAIEHYCSTQGMELVALIPDVMSGKRTDKLYGRIAAITAIRTGMANVLVVNTLDRSSRSMADGAKLVADAKVEGWRIVGLDGTDSETVSQLTAHARLPSGRGRARAHLKADQAGADQGAAGRKAARQAKHHRA